jgi:protein-tyrosine phosphatase
MNAIRPGLYVGKFSETLDTTLLAAHEIGAMLQLAEAVNHPGIESLFLPVVDGVPLAHHHVRQGVDFVGEQRRLGRNVLIACGAGISRSTAFAVAVLKDDEGLSLLDALRAVKSRNPVTLIHPALWQSLCTFFGEEVPIRLATDVMVSSG